MDLNNSGIPFSILRAVKNGQLEEVRKSVLENGSDLSHWSEGHHLLRIAIQSRNFEIVQFLLQQNVKVVSEDDELDSSLHLAVKFSGDDCNIVELLINFNAPIDCTDRFGSTPIQTAVQLGYEKIVSCLLSKGASLSNDGPDEETLLHGATRKGHQSIMKLLLEKRANVNAVSKSGQTPLHLAASVEREETLELLLNFQANIDAVDGAGNTPLHYAVLNKSEKNVKLLLENGAEINFPNTVTKRTPLHTAAENGFDKIIQILLNHQAFLQAVDIGMNTPLHLAAQNKLLSTTVLLLKNKASVDTINANGETPLHLASLYGTPTVVEALIKNNAQVNAVNMKGDTPVNRVLDPTMLNSLLKFNANINHQGNSNQTVLHHAVLFSNTQAVLFLLNHVINTNLEDSSGDTALTLAVSLLRRSNNPEVARPPHRRIHSHNNMLLILLHENDSRMENRFGFNQKLEIIISHLKKHVIKQKVAGWQVNEKDLNLINENLNDELSHFEQDCVEELNRIKLEKLGDDLSLFDLMSKYQNLNFARNEPLMERLFSLNIEQFPVYQNFLSFIISCSKKNIFRLNLVASGLNSLKILVRVGNLFSEQETPDLPDELLEKIVLFLNDSELEALNICRKELLT